MVGYAMAALPQETPVPWQRVINSQGKISQRSYGFGGEMQRLLLQEEGIIFDRNGCIDINIYGWNGPGE
jgi:methylated-DNA-protein-cysteine methyltransferase related protein